MVNQTFANTLNLGLARGVVVQVDFMNPNYL